MMSSIASHVSGDADKDEEPSAEQIVRMIE